MATTNTHTYTIGLTEAKANLNKIAQRVNETGRPVTVFKRNRPYVTIGPVQETPNDETMEALREMDSIRRDPTARTYQSADELFDDLGL